VLAAREIEDALWILSNLAKARDFLVVYPA
jgi:hypothetical protein